MMELRSPPARRVVALGQATDATYDNLSVVVFLSGGHILDMPRAEAQALVDRLRRMLAFQATEWGYPEPVDAPVDRVAPDV